MLTVTDKATAQIREIIKRENIEDAALRLYISGVG